MIRDVDVSGHSCVLVNQIPGNVLTPKSWRVVMFVDDAASTEQHDAIVAAFTGQLGGPLADLAGVYGEIVDVQTAPVVHDVGAGRGMLRVGDAVAAEMHPYIGADGATITTLRDSVFSTVPGSPAYVAKADRQRVDLPQYGMVWSFEGRNAIQADWKLTYRSPE